jgi:hypothetical protein
MVHGGRHASGHQCSVGNQRVDEASTGNQSTMTRSGSRGGEIGGRSGSNRWALGGDDCGAGVVMGQHFTCWVGPGCYSSRPAGRKTARELFQNLNSLFQLIDPQERSKLERKYLQMSEKDENVHGGRFEYLSQLLYWAL